MNSGGFALENHLVRELSATAGTPCTGVRHASGARSALGTKGDIGVRRRVGLGLSPPTSIPAIPPLERYRSE